MAEKIKGSDVAKVYAEALFDLARQANAADEVRDQLQELVSLQEADPAFDSFLTSMMVDDEDRQRSLEKMFRGRLDDNLLNTLLVMNRHGRAGLLPQLLRAFILQIQAARGEIEVTATSAVDLLPVEQAETETLARQLTGKQPLIEFRVDPAIIGGLVLQMGGRRYDNSVRRQLEVARQKLLDRSSRGLEISMG